MAGLIAWFLVAGVSANLFAGERPVEELVEQLQSSDRQERRDAAWELAELGDAATAAIPALTKALHDDDTQVCAESTRALAGMGPAAEQAIDDLLQRMDTDDDQRRYRSAHALGRIGVAALPKLRQRLHSDQTRVRRGAVQAIGWIGPRAADVVPELIVLLDDADEEVRRLSRDSLGRIGESATAALSESLDSDQARVQEGAAQALAMIGPPARLATEKLVLWADAAKDTRARGAIISALGRIHPEGDDGAIVSLLKAIGDGSEDVHGAAVASLLRLHPDVQESVAPALSELLSDDAELARRIALVLGGFGPHAKSAVPDMLQYLTRFPEAKSMARAIGRTGEPALDPTLAVLRAGKLTSQQVTEIIDGMPAQVKSQLADALADENPLVREIAVLTIGKLVPLPGNAVRALTNGLADPQAEVRAAAALSLHRIGRKAKSALPTLKEHLEQDESALVRRAAALAFGDLEETPNRVIEALDSRLSDPDVSVRLATLLVLSNVDALPESMHASIGILLREDDDPEVRGAATRAIVRIKEKRRETAAWVIAALDDKEQLVRELALKSIAELGSDAKAAVAVISKQLSDEAPKVRVAAIESLSHLGVEAEPALEVITGLASDATEDVRVAVVKCLRKITRDKDRVLPVLIQALEDQEWGVRRQAAEELGNMEEDAAPAVPALLRMLRKDDESDVARSALREINTAGDDAIPILLEILQDEKAGRRSRYYALFLLRKMGPRAQVALPILEKQREAADGRQREYLDRAIKEIKGEEEDE
jgi:HEAT repeat protein